MFRAPDWHLLQLPTQANSLQHWHRVHVPHSDLPQTRQVCKSCSYNITSTLGQGIRTTNLYIMYVYVYYVCVNHYWWRLPQEAETSNWVQYRLASRRIWQIYILFAQIGAQPQFKLRSPAFIWAWLDKTQLFYTWNPTVKPKFSYIFIICNIIMVIVQP